MTTSNAPLPFVYLPLGGDKRPIVKGWNKPDYPGVSLNEHKRVALRADERVIIDCENDIAAGAWLKRTNMRWGDTYTVKTPRGWHFYYRWTPGSPTGPAVKVLPETDVRAGRGSYVVAPPTEGYVAKYDLFTPAPFNPEWLPRKTQEEVLSEIEEVDFIPEGRRETSLVQLAGVMRRQGLTAQAIVRNLTAFNRLSVEAGDDPITHADIVRIARSVARYDPEPDDTIVVVNDEDEATPERTPFFLDARKMKLPPPPKWWWKPYLPQGRLVMLDGEEGIGKGMFCVWLAKLSAEGAGFPGESALEPAPVVWFAAEDDPEEDILRRLYASGWEPEHSAPIYFFDPRKDRWRFPTNTAHLRATIAKLKPRFVILDPGRSFIAPPDPRDGSYNSETAMRPGLEALQHIAHDTKTTIVWVHHWNKITNGSTRDKMGGTVAFLQVVRHRVTLAQVGEYRAFSVEKSNLIDKNHHVRAMQVLGNDALEAGYAVIGDRLPNFRGLDEWIEETSSLEAEMEQTIEVDFDWEDAALFYAYLQEGSIPPSVSDIQTDLKVNEDTAKRLRRKLRDLGIISGGKASRWTTLPPELAERAKIVRGEA